MKPVPFAQASEEERARRLLTLWDDILHLPAEPAGCARCSAGLEQFVGDWLLGGGCGAAAASRVAALAGVSRLPGGVRGAG